MELNWRFASVEDARMLAEWNWQLIRDEGHRNPMTVDELTGRMRDWLRLGYKALVFLTADEPIGYAVFIVETESIHLRHFFVGAPWRRRGCGRAGFRILREEVWPHDVRLTVNALCRNPPGVAFWRAMGFADYCLTLEMRPVVAPAEGPSTPFVPHSAQDDKQNLDAFTLGRSSGDD